MMVLITTKNSNILEDLETLRMFAKVVPEYCREMTEEMVCHSAFELIFAFDEIVSLGYRENVNLSQIKTQIEMDSHEENIYKMVKKNKENEQKEVMKRRAKEIQLDKKLRGGLGGGGSGSGGQGGGGGDSGMNGNFGLDSFVPPAAKPASRTESAPVRKGPRKGGMMLKKKGQKDADFLEKLQAEGQAVVPDDAPHETRSTSSSTRKPSSVEPSLSQKGVHVKIDEKIMLTANRDGGLEAMEIKGIMFVVVNDAECAKIKVQTSITGSKNIPMQTHLNVDKKEFNSVGVIALKQDRPFPVKNEVGVLKWRHQTTDESEIPLTVNCWPTVNPDGSADVNVDYELVDTEMRLEDVTIIIPVPGSPTINDCDGEYQYDKRDGVLEWTIPLVDKDNTEGSLAFVVNEVDASDQFFPVSVGFNSEKTFSGVKVDGIIRSDGGDVEYSQEASFSPDVYEYV